MGGREGWTGGARLKRGAEIFGVVFRCKQTFIAFGRNSDVHFFSPQNHFATLCSTVVPDRSLLRSCPSPEPRPSFQLWISSFPHRIICSSFLPFPSRSPSFSEGWDATVSQWKNTDLTFLGSQSVNPKNQQGKLYKEHIQKSAQLLAMVSIFLIQN